MSLPLGALLYIYDGSSWHQVSEHNRQPVTVGYNRIEKSQRMSNGSLRKYFIADKKIFNLSWSMLPSYSTMTVDGGYGALDLKSFYEGSNGKGTFKIKIKYHNDSHIEGTGEMEVYFTSASFDMLKRNVKSTGLESVSQQFWNVSITLEEV
jgi:uncharacterized protein YutD